MFGYFALDTTAGSFLNHVIFVKSIYKLRILRDKHFVREASEQNYSNNTEMIRNLLKWQGSMQRVC